MNNCLIIFYYFLFVFQNDELQPESLTGNMNDKLNNENNNNNERLIRAKCDISTRFDRNILTIV